MSSLLSLPGVPAPIPTGPPTALQTTHAVSQATPHDCHPSRSQPYVHQERIPTMLLRQVLPKGRPVSVKLVTLCWHRCWSCDRADTPYTGATVAAQCTMGRSLMEYLTKCDVNESGKQTRIHTRVHTHGDGYNDICKDWKGTGNKKQTHSTALNVFLGQPVGPRPHRCRFHRMPWAS